MSQLILPASAQPEPPKRQEIDPPVASPSLQISEDIREKLATIQDTLLDLVQSDQGILALCESPAFRSLLQTYVNKISASLGQSLIRSDRDRIISILGEVEKNREIHVRMRKEQIVMGSYRVAISDCVNILRQTPPPQYSVKVGTTTENTAPNSSETPSNSVP